MFSIGFLLIATLVASTPLLAMEPEPKEGQTRKRKAAAGLLSLLNAQAHQQKDERGPENLITWRETGDGNYQCTICNKIVNKPVAHSRVHTGYKPFQCPYGECINAYTTGESLNQHIREVHKNNNSNNSPAKKVRISPQVPVTISPAPQKIQSTGVMAMVNNKAAFFDAIRANDVAATRQLIAQGQNVNEEDEKGMTALVCAAGMGFNALVDTLIEGGADVNKATMDEGLTPLMCATKSDTKIVSRLIAAGADVNTQDRNGMTALMFAARNGFNADVEKLIDAHADVDKQMADGSTALMMAAYNGYVAIVTKLINAGADVNKQTSSGITALILAAQNGFESTVEQLIDAGSTISHIFSQPIADTSTQLAQQPWDTQPIASVIQVTPNASFHVAQQPEEESYLNRIIELVPDSLKNIAYQKNEIAPVDSLFNDEILPHEILVNDDQNAFIEKFMAEIDGEINDEPRALDLFNAVQQQDAQLVDNLIESGADVNKQDTHGNTALIVAAHNGNTVIVEKLIAAGAKVNCANHDALNPLLLAVQGGHYGIAKKLIAVGADVNKPNNHGNTALMIAAHQGHIITVEKLIAAGADIARQNNDGFTALMFASSRCHTAIVEKLIEAEHVQRANTMKKAMNIAKASDHSSKAVINVLKKAGK